jgi:hypothetical protein
MVQGTRKRGFGENRQSLTTAFTDDNIQQGEQLQNSGESFGTPFGRFRNSGHFAVAVSQKGDNQIEVAIIQAADKDGGG